MIWTITAMMHLRDSPRVVDYSMLHFNPEIHGFGVVIGDDSARTTPSTSRPKAYYCPTTPPIDGDQYLQKRQYYYSPSPILASSPLRKRVHYNNLSMLTTSSPPSHPLFAHHKSASSYDENIKTSVHTTNASTPIASVSIVSPFGPEVTSPVRKRTPRHFSTFDTTVWLTL